MAAFDLDSTLILSNRGGKYAKALKDWMWQGSDVPQKLQQLHSQGYTLAIFTNRKGPPWLHKATQARVDLILATLQLPAWVFMATRDDVYRKPDIGMVQLFAQLAQIKAWSAESFYCGDAAGPEAKGASPDLARWYQWSTADIGLAAAMNLPFKCPEEVFAQHSTPAVPPSNLILTVGQYNSGWELLPLGRYTLLDGRSFEIVDSATVGTAEVVLVRGAFPTRRDRETIIAQYPGRSPTIYWYARPAWDETGIVEHCKVYSKAFEEINQPHYRIN